MASKSKKSFQVSRSSPQRGTSFDLAEESAVSSIVDRVSQGLLEQLRSEVEGAEKCQLDHAVWNTQSVVGDRVKLIKEACSSLAESMEFLESRLREENKQLNDRVCELESKMSEIEHSIAQQEHEANLLVSGVAENGGY